MTAGNKRHRTIRPLLLFVVMTATFSISLAQNYRDDQRNPNYRQNDRFNPTNNPDLVGLPPTSGSVDNNAEQGEDTTTRKPRIRKPLESWYFTDTMRSERIFAWKVRPQYNDIIRAKVDTLIDDFQIDYSYMKEELGSANLGNLGGATVPLNYFLRPTPENFSFVKVWDTYIYTPEKVMFYNAKTPYSRLSYSMSGAAQVEENLFNFIISHNVSPSTSVSLTYNADGTRGIYNRQKTLDRYFAMNLAHTGKKYAIHGGYIYNVGDVDENGGIKDDREVTDTVIDVSQNILVNLKNANNTYRGHTFYFTQSYGIPMRKMREDELTIQKIPTLFVGQAFDYTLFKKTYTDKSDGAFFQNNYLNKDFTRDSMAQSMADVKLFIQLQPYNRDGVLGLLSAGIGNQTNRFYYNPVPETLREQWGKGGTTTRNSTYVYGSVEGSVKKYMQWQADLRYYLMGYRNQDFEAKGMLRLSAFVKDKPLTLEGNVRFALVEPDYFVQQFFSNHYAWSNSFSKETITQISAKFTVPSIGMALGADYQMSFGKVYYDENSLPAQFNSSLNMLGVYLQKDFRIGGFQLNHRVLMQISSDQKVAPVPLLSAFVSYSYLFDVVKNVLKMEVGVDARYNTKYYGFGYNPAIAQFYNQREKEIGNYPYLDAFIAMKWKRMRILGKLQHFNANLFGTQEYFAVLHQPASRMMFKLGISWSFYD